MNTAAVMAAVVVVAAAAALGGYAYYHYSTGTVNVYVTTGDSDPIYVTFTSVEMHSTSGPWITVSNRTETVQLNGNLSFLTSGTVPPGNYTEVGLEVSQVTVGIGDVNFTAKLPSEVLKVPIAGGLHVGGGSTAKLEVIFGPHLVQTGNGQYILSPVVVARQIQ